MVNKEVPSCCLKEALSEQDELQQAISQAYFVSEKEAVATLLGTLPLFWMKQKQTDWRNLLLVQLVSHVREGRG